MSRASHETKAKTAKLRQGQCRVWHDWASATSKFRRSGKAVYGLASMRRRRRKESPFLFESFNIHFTVSVFLYKIFAV